MRLREPMRQSEYCVCLECGNFSLQTFLLCAKHTVGALWIGLVNPGVRNEEDS